MKTYLVGGCVRDKLLGRPVKDRDWVVTGSSVEQMLELGFLQVGKDFPVFLHPKTKEEYALARTERKTAPGYTGFEFNASPKVSLEDDLLRRDLTINAIAESESGELIDPFAGRKDIDKRILRHISPAFSEDPVRILRVARFAARYAALGFKIAEETVELMNNMVNNGEVDSLVPERVWQETHSALTEPNPEVFFESLKSCGALTRIFPEIDNLYGVPQPEKYHPEIDTGIHTMMVLQQASKLSKDAIVRFAALVHDLGKATTPKEEWPRHIAHEERGVPLVEVLCQRLKVPKQYRELAVLVTRYHLHYHRAAELKASTLHKTFMSLDAYRRPERFEQFLQACEADSRGRPGYENMDFQQPAIMRAALAAANSVETSQLVSDGFKGKELAEKLTQLRIHAISEV
ncbi:MAG: multifunctional CCA addition/repair protein [Gammaproteobacteria bacterium]|nr:multifunctional CCA addition/repair protein [Gammaproteobacteria bacterium]